MAWFKRLWIPITLIALMLGVALLFSTIHPYQLLANHYIQPALPPQRFDPKLWPQKPYSEKQLCIRQSMSDSIQKEFKPGLTRREIEEKLGPPDRTETEQELMTISERDQNFARGDIAISYIVLQDFSSGPFTLCFVLGRHSTLRRVYYRWG